MAAVSETIVREYFEELGYFVRQPNKYQVAARAKRDEEEVDLVVTRPGATQPQALPIDMLWTTDTLRHVARAVVGIRGWHTERFSAALIERDPDLLRFARDEVVASVTDAMGLEKPVACLLCIPGLPASLELRELACEALRGCGIDGVLTFRTMLDELISRVDVNRNYEKSDTLQLLRILKSNDLVRGPQLELIEWRRARSASGGN